MTSLPAEVDTKVIMRPALRAFARRVRRHNVWVWYVVTDDEVALVAVSTDPPVPEE